MKQTATNHQWCKQDLKEYPNLRPTSQVIRVYLQPFRSNSLLKCEPQPKIAKKTPKSSIVQSSRSFNVIQGHRHFFTVSMINNDRHGRKNWTWNGVQRMLFEAHTWLHNYVINSVEISHNERQLAKSPEIRKTFFGLNNNCKTRAKFRPNFCQYCPVRRRRTGTTFWRGGGGKTPYTCRNGGTMCGWFCQTKNVQNCSIVEHPPDASLNLRCARIHFRPELNPPGP